MAELLNVISSLAATLQLMETVVEFLNNSKDASKDCGKLLKEISGVKSLLLDLKDPAGKAKSGVALLLAFSELAAPHGPLPEFKLMLERLATHLEPAVGSKKNQKVLARPFRREKLRDIFRSIDQLRTVCLLGLQKDPM
jgi:hypothetical protein